jgi:2-methylcitrate dehydratase PrpD
MAKNKLDVNSIKSIRVSTFSELVEEFKVTKPTSVLDAQFSLPYLIALELLGKSPSKGLSEDDLTDPRVEYLAEKVFIELSPEIDQRFKQNKNFMSAVVFIEQMDGTVLSQRVDIPKWDPETRPSREELQTKFTFLTAPIVGINASQAIMSDIDQLEHLKDISSMILRVSEALYKL